MELYIHIGTNKTGSSYLQSTITLNRATLLSQGVYAPKSKWDDSMLKGLITPGNGHELALIVTSEDRKIKLQKYFNRIMEEAKAERCSKVLLSNEMLIRFFSDSEILNDLEIMAKKAGFTKIHYLAYFRNLYEHALSLYKHRAKFGKHPEYALWFRTDYETLRLLQPLLTNIKSSSSEFTFVPYEKESGKIINRCSNWLKLNPESLELFKNEVNPSLTLNQINWIQTVNERYDGIAPKLYKVLTKTKGSEENERLVSTFFDTASSYFEQYQLLIHEFKSNFFGNDRMILDERPIAKTSNYATKSNFLTTLEFLSIQDEIQKFSRFYRWNRFVYYFRYYGRRLFLSSVGKKKNNLDTDKFGGSLRN